MFHSFSLAILFWKSQKISYKVDRFWWLLHFSLILVFSLASLMLHTLVNNHPFFLCPSISLSLASSSSFFLSLFFLLLFFSFLSSFFSFLFFFFLFLFLFLFFFLGWPSLRAISGGLSAVAATVLGVKYGVPPWVTVSGKIPVWQLGAWYFFPPRCLTRFFFSFYIFFFSFFSFCFWPAVILYGFWWRFPMIPIAFIRVRSERWSVGFRSLSSSSCRFFVLYLFCLWNP